MDKYINSGGKYNADSKFMTRYANLKASEEATSREFNAKEEFKVGYKAGNLRVCVASRFMSLKNCGLDTYLENETNNVWKKEGDRIIRVTDDLSWVDEFLNGVKS